MLFTRPAKKFWIFFGSALLLCMGVFLWQKREWVELGADSQSVYEEVSEIIELPKEAPEIAVVADKNKLPDQPFFAKAENGDQVFIFKESKRAILYRPGLKKIIEASSISESENP